MANKVVLTPQWRHNGSHETAPFTNESGPNIARDATRGKKNHAVNVAWGNHRHNADTGMLHPSGHHVSAVQSGGALGPNPLLKPPAPKRTQTTPRAAQLGRAILSETLRPRRDA